VSPLDALRAPIHYVCTTPSNLLGLRYWLEGIHFLAAADFFDGHLPRLAYPARVTEADLESFERMNDRILEDAGVRRYIEAQGTGGCALFLMLDEANEAAARRAGLSIGLPPHALRQTLDDKVATTRLGDEVGVRSVPNVLARIDSYATLRSVAAALGPDLVIQLPFGDSGQTTFFIGSEQDYLRYAPAIEAAGNVKIMRRIRCRQAAIEACITRRGVAVGPLATELIGFPELTPYGGGWCGNEIAPAAFDEAIMDEAVAITERFGERLSQLGYRGVFGLDFLIDEGSGDLFLGELNPRITGLSPLTTQAARDIGCAPLMLLHLLEWLDVAHTIDIADTSARFRRLEGARAWSQLIVKETRRGAPAIAHAPASGIWRTDADGIARPFKASFDSADVHDEGDALVLRTLMNGWERPRGTALARVMSPGRMMTDDYTLLPRAHAWIASVHRAFEAAHMPALVERVTDGSRDPAIAAFSHPDVT